MGKPEFKFEVDRIETYCRLQETSIREWEKDMGKVVEESDPVLAKKVRAVREANLEVLNYLASRKDR